MHGNSLDHASRTVLVGSTLGPESDAVVRSALAIARYSGARVLPLHALEPQSQVAAGLLSFAMVRDGISAAARERLSAQLRRLGARTSEVADIAVDVPPVHRALLRAAARSRAGWLVVGFNTDDPRAPRIGSVSLRLLRRSLRPVWLVRGQEPAIPTLVLAPVDLTAQSAAALHRGLQALASCFPAASTEVIVLHALADDDPREPVDAQRELESALTVNAARFAGRLRGMVRRGALAPVVVATVVEKAVDVVLLSGHGRSGRSRCAAEPILEAVTREATCAVLLVPSAASERCGHGGPTKGTGETT